MNGGLLRKDVKPIYLVMLVFLAVLSFGLMAIHTNNPLLVKRFIYPVEAVFEGYTTRCSGRSAAWLDDVLKKIVFDGYSLDNQIVYIDSKGVVAHCESGWEGAVLRSARVTVDTRFRYASLTKIVTAAAIINLTSNKLLSLDENLVDILELQGDFVDSKIEEITIRQLLSHEAGFDRLKTPDIMFARSVKPWCPDDLDELSNIQLDYIPGSKMEYSNLGYCLLGAVVEKVTGKLFRKYVFEEFPLEALGMEFVNGPYLEDEVRYDFRNDDFFGESHIKYFDFESLSSVAGLSGSAKSFAVLLNYLNDNVMSPFEYEVSSEICDLSEIHSCYGLAYFQFQRDPTSPVMQIHDGRLPGLSSLVVLDESGSVLVWLGAGTPFDSFEKQKSLYKYLYSALLYRATK